MCSDSEQASTGSGRDKPLPYVFDVLHDVEAGFMPALSECKQGLSSVGQSERYSHKHYNTFVLTLKVHFFILPAT